MIWCFWRMHSWVKADIVYLIGLNMVNMRCVDPPKPSGEPSGVVYRAFSMYVIAWHNKHMHVLDLHGQGLDVRLGLIGESSR
jgi:hypothetical protein